MKTKSQNAAKSRTRQRAEISGSFKRISSLASYMPNKIIFNKGEPAEYLYKVESGCIRTYSEFDGGLRRIHAFYFAGDYFGMEPGEAHSLSAQAVTASSLRLIKMRALMARAARDIEMVKFLLAITTSELQRTQSHNLLLLKGARERIIDFLLDLQRRKQNGSEIDLPMPRRDIADYLGLTIETVSRALTRLRNTSAISLLSSRRVILRDPPAPGPYQIQEPDRPSV